MFHALLAQQGQPQGDPGFFGNPNVMFWMLGLMLLFWFIIVIPSLDLVIVRTGDDREDRTNLSKLITLAMAVAQ